MVMAFKITLLGLTEVFQQRDFLSFVTRELRARVKEEYDYFPNFTLDSCDNESLSRNEIIPEALIVLIPQQYDLRDHDIKWLVERVEDAVDMYGYKKSGRESPPRAVGWVVTS
jgi:hypothetical protein